ncbi:MAG: hypothetical protein P4L79_09925 [Legionella sp.]|uniref:hypothetical protein n=1 Tax=Legionella sp. TaxID=459 RepID=UPI002847D45C|nr:hypothetical protein [Legionella sp.]
MRNYPALTFTTPYNDVMVVAPAITLEGILVHFNESTDTDLLSRVIRHSMIHDIGIYPTKEPFRGWASPYDMYAVIPQINGPISYSIAMHEIGHCCMTPFAEKLTKPLFDIEKDAWNWAKTNSDFWTPNMTDFMNLALLSYDERIEFDSRVEACVFAKKLLNCEF